MDQFDRSGGFSAKAASERVFRLINVSREETANTALLLLRRNKESYEICQLFTLPNGSTPLNCSVSFSRPFKSDEREKQIFSLFLSPLPLFRSSVRLIGGEDRSRSSRTRRHAKCTRHTAQELQSALAYSRWRHGAVRKSERR